jgi:hypothetical protein
MFRNDEIWDNFAQAIEELETIYPEIKNSDIWKMLVSIDLVADHTKGSLIRTNHEEGN